MNIDELFPHVKDSIDRFMYDEEGNIPRSKILTIGSMMLLFTLLLSDQAWAAHRSHSSHSSHRSHSSHSSHSSYSYHSSHSSHSSHSNYSTHASHSNHANHSSHSNAAPGRTELNLINTPQASDALLDRFIPAEASTEMSLPDILVPPDTPPVR